MDVYYNLKLNPYKTESIIFGSKRQKDKLEECFRIDLLSSPLCPVVSVKNMGLWFDSNFSLFRHVQNVCKNCFVKLHDFRNVRRFLSHDVSVLVANGLVSSRKDYCISFSGASPNSIYVSYSASKIVQPELYQTPVDTPV